MKKKTAWYGMILALALLVSYVENLIPIPIAIPGIKLGLANSVILCILYKEGIKEAAAISFLRIVLVGFLFGNMAAVLYSVAGAVSSIFIMYLLKRINRFTIIGVSIAGGAAHNAGQLFVAARVVGTAAVFYYIPVLLLAGSVTGLLIGIISREVQKRLPREQ